MGSLGRAAAMAAAGLLAVAAPLAAARVASIEKVAVRMLPPDDGDAEGRLGLEVKSRGDATVERLDFRGSGLDATRDGNGDLPQYHLVLVSGDGGTEADFGSVFLNRAGKAKLAWNSRRADPPEGLESLADMGGGTAELRLGDDVVLAGDIPEFLSIDDENEPGSRARAIVKGSKRLKPASRRVDARGRVEAQYVNHPREDREAIRVEVEGLGSGGDEFDVVLVDDGGEDVRLGTLTTRTRRGVGVLVLSTRADDEIPGDGVLSLGGFEVEVRAGDGTVVLHGTFPELRTP